MASFVRGGGTGSCTKGPRTGKKSTGRRKYSTWNTWETHRKQTFFFGWIWRWGQSLNSTSSPPVWSSWTISRSFTPPQGSSAIDQKKTVGWLSYTFNIPKTGLVNHISFLLFLKFFEAFITFIYEECRHSQIVGNHLHGFITFLYASVAKINSCMSACHGFHFQISSVNGAGWLKNPERPHSSFTDNQISTWR